MMKWVSLLLILLSPVCFSKEKQTLLNYTPNVSNGEKLYQSNCSVCHGAKGMGETVTGKAMKKKPAIIGDPKVLNRLSPEKVYALVTKGITDQGMPSYSHLTEKERWDLAAYVFTLNCNSQKPPAEARSSFTWAEIKTQTDTQIVDILKKRGVPESHIQEELSAARYLLE